MALEREMLPNRTKGRETGLRALPVTKAAHSSLAFAGRLMAVFSTVVDARGSLDEHVLYAGQLRDVVPGRRIPAQLVGDAPAQTPDLSQSRASGTSPADGGAPTKELDRSKCRLITVRTGEFGSTFQFRPA
jgi:hypothetical protein